MFGFIKSHLKNLYTHLKSGLSALFSKKSIDQETLNDLEQTLLKADTGITTTKTILALLQKEYAQGTLETGGQLREKLRTILESMLIEIPYQESSDHLYLMVGINGSGKTTSAAKLAAQLKDKGYKVLMVAADTFRAAAVEQLVSWGKALDIPVWTGSGQQDPAAVIYGGCQEYVTQRYNALIIDTAGRLQTKTNLMKEMEKIGKVVQKNMPGKKVTTLLTIDSMLGQNSLSQATLFHESTPLSGIILTKMDSTAKGGIVFAIAHTLRIPLAYITFGEQIEQIKPFEAVSFVDELLS